MQGRRRGTPFTRDEGEAPLPPLLVIQGGTDNVVARSNAMEAARLWSGVEGQTKEMPPRQVRRGSRHQAVVTDYRRRVDGGLVATVWLVDGLGHAWSGGARNLSYSDPRGPDASRIVWRFCAKRFAE
jgi:poly(3-hydroxybutyrate) depolymerase